MKKCLLLCCFAFVTLMTGCATTAPTTLQYPGTGEIQRRDTEIQTQELRNKASQPLNLPPRPSAPIIMPTRYH